MNPRRPPRVRLEPAPPETRAAGSAAAVAADTVGKLAPTTNPVVGVLLLHPELAQIYMPFSDYVKNRGLLDADDRRLAIMRTAWSCGADHQWVAHARDARAAGVADDVLARIAVGPDASEWTDHERAILRATDELHADRDISDECWAVLARDMSPPCLIELIMLVGNYEMIAMLMNAGGIPPAEPAPGLPGHRFRTAPPSEEH